MTWPKIVILAWIAWSALLVVSNVGKRREPATPSDAVASIILSGLLAWLVVIA